MELVKIPYKSHGKLNVIDLKLSPIHQCPSASSQKIGGMVKTSAKVDKVSQNMSLLYEPMN